MKNYVVYSLDTPLTKGHINADDLPEVILNHDGTEAYHSLFDLESREDYKGFKGISKPASDWIICDFDGISAQKDVKILLQNLNAPPASYRVYFSGNKGFHLYLHSSLIGVKPGPDCADKLEGLFKRIKTALSLESLDTGIIQPIRKIRMPNSLHQKSGFYKVELDAKEFISREHSMEEIKQSAQSPKGITLFKGTSDFDSLPFFEQFKAAIVTPPRESVDGGQQSDDLRYKKYEVFKNKLCVKRMLADRCDEGGRHRTALILVNDFYKTGEQKSVAKEKIFKWGRDNGMGEQRIDTELDKMVNDIYSGATSYSFGCRNTQEKRDKCSGKCAVFKHLKPEHRPDVVDAPKSTKLDQKIDLNIYLAKFSEEFLYQHDPVSDKTYVWAGTHYERLTDTQVKGWFEKATGHGSKNDDAAEFLGKIKRNHQMKPSELNKFFYESIAGKLNLGNGVLDVKTKKLTPHDPAIGFTSVLPFNYDENADSPKFEYFLEHVTKSNINLMTTLVQYIGYCLIPGYKNMGHYILWMLGSGRNGKSTYFEIIKALVGDDNAESVLMDSMTDLNQVDLMRHKLVNFSGEAGGRKISDKLLNIIKCLSSGDPIAVSQKYERGSVLIPTAKLIFSSNTEPNIGENQQAMRSRLIFVPFERKLEDDTMSIVDGELINQIKAELPGVLNTVLAGMDSCWKRGRYEIHIGQESKTLMREAMVEGDAFESWIEQHVRIVDRDADKMCERGVTYSALLKSFETYLNNENDADESDVRMSTVSMAKRIRNKFRGEVSMGRKYITNNVGKSIQVRVVYGVQLVE